MVTVAQCLETPGKYVRYTVSSAATIPKGTLLALSSPNTAAAASGDNDAFAGVAWMEKNAADASTEIVAAIDGTWGFYASAATGTVTAGNDVVIKGVNTVGPYTTLDDEKGYVVGKALETVSQGEVVAVRLKGY